MFVIVTTTCPVSRSAAVGGQQSWQASQPVWTGSALRDSHRFHRVEDSKTGCCDYHESRGLPPCQQLQSGQLEAEPEGYLSVFRVERFTRNQKTEGNKSDEGA